MDQSPVCSPNHIRAAIYTQPLMALTGFKHTIRGPKGKGKTIRVGKGKGQTIRVGKGKGQTRGAITVTSAQLSPLSPSSPPYHRRA